ncbi:MAG TPA: carbohydrate kinase [Myxococcales bacterium]|nr:carbohydrate kinase [Myxococcales bacterium]
MAAARDLHVVCAGETLVDFLPLEPGRAVKDVERWRPCPGGSPANVAVGVARLGGRSAMVGAVGRDELGDFLKERLAQEGVDVSRLRQTDEGKTGLVFISLTGSGERSFAHYRTRSAEFFFSGRDLDPAFLARARAVHLGSNSLLFAEAQRAMIQLARAAREAGQIVCCDPNLRLECWPDPGELKRTLEQLLPCCTVVKLAEDELAFATGEASPDGALRALERMGVPLPVVTLGAAGARLSFRGARLEVGAKEVKVVDTTGAGDGFVAALLFGLTRRCAGREEVLGLDAAEIQELAGFACQAASRVCERLGAVDGLPRAGELQAIWPASLSRD